MNALSSPGSSGQANKDPFRLGSLLVLVLLGVLLAFQLLEPRFFLRDDNATHFLPAYDYAYTTVSGGEIPLLNHHQMFGGTFLASGQTGVFLFLLYPVHAALGVLGIDPIYLIDTLATLHLLLAGVGMWVLLRYLGLRPALAFPLALCWALLPFGVVVGRSWIFVTYLMAYLPFHQWLLLRCLKNPTAAEGARLVLLKVVFLYSGYLHYAILAFFFEACFLLLHGLQRTRAEILRPAKLIGSVYVLTALLSAPLLVPTWNAKQASWLRVHPLPEDAALASSLSLAETLKAHLFASADSSVYGNLSNAVFFLGPLWLIGLLLCLPFWRRLLAKEEPPALAFFLTGAFALLMSTPLYWLLFQFPIFNVLRWPFKGFPIAAFLLLLPAAISLARWAEARPARLVLAVGLTWLNVLLELCVLAPAHWRAPIGPFRIDRTVAELRASPLLQAIGDQGRVALLASERDPPEPGNPLTLGFLYPTLFGKYHVHGYDPLKARINVQMGYPLGNDSQLRLQVGAWPEILPRLKARYLILRASSHLLTEIENATSPTLRRLVAHEDLVLYENLAAMPIVSRAEDGQPVTFRWRTQGIEVDLPPEFLGGHLLIVVANLDGYRWYLNGQNQGAPQQHLNLPLLKVPPGQNRVELRYRDRGFDLGLLLCSLGLLLMLTLLRRGDSWLQGRLEKEPAADVEVAGKLDIANG